MVLTIITFIILIVALMDEKNAYNYNIKQSEKYVKERKENNIKHDNVNPKYIK